MPDKKQPRRSVARKSTSATSSDTQQVLSKLLTQELGQEIWHRSDELLERIDRHEVQFRNSRRSLRSELHRVGVSDLVVRCILLPLIAWAEERKPDAASAHKEIKKKTRRSPAEPRRPIEYVRLLLEAPDALVQIEQLAPTLYGELMASVTRDADRAREQSTRLQLSEHWMLAALRIEIDRAASLTPLTRHLCDVMAAATSHRDTKPKRHHRIVGQLLMACGLEEPDATSAALTLRVKQRDLRASATPK